MFKKIKLRTQNLIHYVQMHFHDIFKKKHLMNYLMRSKTKARDIIKTKECSSYLKQLGKSVILKYQLHYC